jgi:peptidyl-prolyl cis-trans isomerase C
MKKLMTPFSNPIYATALLTIILMLAYVSLCQAQQTDDTVLAEIGNDKITMRDFINAAKKVSTRGEIGLKREEKLQLLENLIAQKILFNEAIMKGIDKRPEVTDEINKVKVDIIVKFFLNEQITSKVSVTQEEARKYYEDNISKYSTPDTAKVTHFHITKENNKGELNVEKARKISHEIAKELSGGKSYNDVKTQLKSKEPDFSETISEELSATVAPGRLYKETNFDETVFSLKEGGYGVAEVPDRFIIIRLDQLIKGQPVPFENIEQTVTISLKQEKWARLLRNYVDSLRTKYPVKTFTDEIK